MVSKEWLSSSTIPIERWIVENVLMCTDVSQKVEFRWAEKVRVASMTGLAGTKEPWGWELGEGSQESLVTWLLLKLKIKFPRSNQREGRFWVAKIGNNSCGQGKNLYNSRKAELLSLVVMVQKSIGLNRKGDLVGGKGRVKMVKPKVIFFFEWKYVLIGKLVLLYSF